MLWSCARSIRRPSAARRIVSVRVNATEAWHDVGLCRPIGDLYHRLEEAYSRIADGCFGGLTHCPVTFLSFCAACHDTA